jgi:NADPH:quinone reductase-like Zn-dependent oxidoreductase
MHTTAPTIADPQNHIPSPSSGSDPSRPVAPAPPRLAAANASARQHEVMTGDRNHPPAKQGTMQAIVQDSYGSPDVLRLARIDRPAIADNQVLVRVHAAGLSRGTWHLMTGRPYLMRLMGFGFAKPSSRVPGLDVAGTVAATGSAVTRFVAGDEVYGISRGSFAEYAVAQEDKLARKPVNTSFEQAAVVPVSALTALQSLCDIGHLQPGQKVLIIGASGGVGTYAVQLAKAFGAEVTGVCSTAKLDLVQSLGADHVIDYTHQDFADGARRYDLILDIAGNPTLSRLRRALTSTGMVVIVGGEGGSRWTGGVERQLRALAWSPFLRQRLTSAVCKERAADLERLTALIEKGEVTSSIDRAYPLDRVPAAMRHLEAGKARGKVAITI